MVGQADSHQLGGPGDAAGEIEIVAARLQTAAGMVVRQHDRKRRVQDGGLQDLARMGARGVERADADRLAADQEILRVQVEAHQVLLAGALQVAHLLVGLLGRPDPELPFPGLHDPPGELEGGGELARLDLADPAAGAPSFQGEDGSPSAPWRRMRSSATFSTLSPRTPLPSTTASSSVLVRARTEYLSIFSR